MTRLRLTGTDLDPPSWPSSRCRASVTGWLSPPASSIGRHRPGPAEPGAVVLSVDGDDATVTAGRAEFSVRTHPGRRLPAPARPGRGRGHAAGRRGLAEALRQVTVRGQHRGHPADPDRRADERRGRRAAPGGHRLLPAGRPRPARHRGAGRGPERAGAVPAPSSELGRLLADGHARSPSAWASTTPPSWSGNDRLTTRLIEGEFPNYRGLIPASYPNRLAVGREAAARRRAPGEAAGPRRHHPGAHRPAPDGIELTVSPRTGPGPRGASTPSTRAPR